MLFNNWSQYLPYQRYVQLSIQPFTIGVDRPELGRLMEVSIMFDIWIYCILLCTTEPYTDVLVYFFIYQLSQWWLHVAYLEFRSPVVVNVSPGIVCPRENINGEAEQLKFAAKFTSGVLDFKHLIDT